MKPVKNAISTLFNFIMGFFFLIMVVGVSVFFTLWQTGVIEDNFPLLYCILSKTPESRIIIDSDTSVAVINYKDNCICDTTHYYFKSADTTHATVQRP